MPLIRRNSRPGRMAIEPFVHVVCDGRHRSHRPWARFEGASMEAADELRKEAGWLLLEPKQSGVLKMVPTDPVLCPECAEKARRGEVVKLRADF